MLLPGFDSSFFGSGAVYLWRSGFSPKNDEPRGRLDRALRVFGAVMLSAVMIYFGICTRAVRVKLRKSPSNNLLCPCPSKSTRPKIASSPSPRRGQSCADI
jgi:hypothetical protein